MKSEPLARMIETGLIRPSPTNPNGRLSGHDFDELVASVRDKGVLQPILVRPIDPALNRHCWEIVFGHRRHAAALAAKRDEIPATVRELSDLEALELQVVENLQRADVHPLDEAKSYATLHAVHKQDVAAIAAKIGRTVVYVYDRLKLLKLIPELQKDFRDGRFTAGHAVLLARLSAADQKRASAINGRDRWHGGEGGLYQAEHTLFDEDHDDPREDHFKARSVAELRGWIDEHVRMAPADTDPMLFPETDAALREASDAKLKIVPITKLYRVPDDARAEGRTYGDSAWKRADGARKSKPCPHGVMGFIVAGPGRGEAFKVCIAKDRCTVHWAAEVKARKQREAEAEKRAAKPGGKTKSKAKPEPPKRDSWQIEQERRRIFEARWRKILPTVMEQVATALAKKSVKPNGELEQALAPVFSRHITQPGEITRLLPAGTDGDTTVRRLAFRLVYRQIVAYDGQYGGDLRLLKQLGIDGRKILNAHIAAEKKAEVAKAKQRKPDPAAGRSSDSGARGKKATRRPSGAAGRPRSAKKGRA